MAIIRSTMESDPRKLVLVVDDDADIRASLRDLLEDEGYLVATAENGADALDYLNREPASPALILLDLMMPVMDGAQFCDLKNQSPTFADVPVVVITAFTHQRSRPTCEGAKAVLNKPVELEELLAAVHRYAR
jgi:CheY-like chemotaxis protein